MTERLINLPRDRKCPVIRGRTGLSSIDGVEEVQACLHVHQLPVEKSLFIFDHLEGEAREEIKYWSKEERKNPDKILDIFLDLYGCTKLYVSLWEAFFFQKVTKVKKHCRNFLMHLCV